METLSKYKVEIALLMVSLIVGVGSFMIFFQNEKTLEEPIQLVKKQAGKITIEVSGAVEKPGVYEVTNGARLKDAIETAHGLSRDADKIFFSRTFNLARLLSDQEKVYIPTKQEVIGGFFQETQSVQSQPAQAAEPKDELLINLNTANQEDLIGLPGVGEKTAQKIIEGRPYSSIDELTTKKIVTKSVFEKIKNTITTN